MSDQLIATIQAAILTYYRAHGRQLPWRQPDENSRFDPYKIMVSELMLQQTQVNRVIPKYQEFLELFPTVFDLAEASLGDVLRIWNGLGYNRRAKYLWQAAGQIVSQWNGELPADPQLLVTLPGIGANTAGAICAYAFDMPVIFIETNVRTVFIHHFYPDKTGVDDQELRPLIKACLDGQSPREFYWALMDYGTHLKAEIGNNIKQSRHYNKQSKFQGSKRQIRGQILRELAQSGARTYAELKVSAQDGRLDEILGQLLQEGLIIRKGKTYQLE